MLNLLLFCCLFSKTIYAIEYKLSDYNSSFDGSPDVFIIGAQKGGTTALAEILVHLKVCALTQPYLKEPQFFSYGFNDQAFNEYITGIVVPLCYLLSINHFNQCTILGFNNEKAKNPLQLTVDASPNYFGEYDSLVNIQKLYSPASIAKKKFILILREPVSR
jgi:hypothetical protein